MRGRVAASGRVILLVFLSLVGFVAPVSAQTNNAPVESPLARAERAFSESRRHLRQEGSAEAGWEFGRACFDWAEFARNNSERADIAAQGIAACRQAIQQNSKLAAAHYYLGLNLGQLARTKKLSALRLVDQMEAAFKAAIALDPAFDYAGPQRSLGLLYLDAPGWPTSIGSRSKARMHLQKAVELCPDYPDNQLSLLEVYLEAGDKKAAQASLQRAGQVLEAARKKFAGDAWAVSWRDWDARWERIKIKTGTTVPALESSRNKK